MTSVRTGRTGAAPRAPRISRAERARNVQTAIDAAALDLLCTHGLDGLALTKVAELASLSNGPLYGRYDSPEDIALDLWERCAREHFTTAVIEFADWLTTTGSDAPELGTRELEQPSPLTIAAVEIVAVARRFPLLADTVRTDLEALLTALARRRPELPTTLTTTALTVTIGRVMLRGLLPDEHTDWSRGAGFLRDVITDASKRTGPSYAPDPLALTMPSAASGDERLDVFIDAVASVVSRVGYERATAQRIARAAGQSFSSAYAHADSKDALMRAAISATIEQLIATGDVAFADLGGEDYLRAVVALERGLCSDTNRAIRTLRVETFLAALHHPELGEVLRASLTGALEFISSLFDPSLGSVADARAVWHVSRCVGIGTVTLSLAVPGLVDLDWTPFARLAQLVMEETVFGLIPAGTIGNR